MEKIGNIFTTNLYHDTMPIFVACYLDHDKWLSDERHAFLGKLVLIVAQK